ncbi:MAG: phosphatidate cytidylyltransferase [bacterium]
MSLLKDFFSRFLIAVFFSVTGLFLAWYSRFTLFVLISSFVLLGLREYASLVERGGSRPMRLSGYALGLFFMTTGYLGPLSLQHHAVVIAVGALVALKAVHLNWDAHRDTVNDLILTLFGSLYVGGALSFIMNLRTIHEMRFDVVTHRDYLFLLPFIGAWAGDTGAYIAGNLLGREKIDAELSRGKTVEGFIGGMASGFAAIYIFGSVLRFPVILSVAMGIIVPLVGTAGDLFESALKRRFAVKDSGTFFHSHGGVLDRFDSVFFALPVVYFLVYYFYIYRT